jgi:hypothetical protein
MIHNFLGHIPELPCFLADYYMENRQWNFNFTLAISKPISNIIENVWKVTKNNFAKRILEIQTKQDLVRVLNEIWTGLSL